MNKPEVNDKLTGFDKTVQEMQECKRMLAVANALCRIGHAKEAMPSLIKLMETSTIKSDTVGVVMALGKFGPDAIEAVPNLIVVMDKNKFNPLGRAAVRALGQIGPDAKMAVPMLLAQPYNIQPKSVEDFYYLIDCNEAVLMISSNQTFKDAAVKALTSVIEIGVKKGLYDSEFYHDKEYDILTRNAYGVYFGDVSIHANAIKVLGKNGPAAKHAVATLLKCASYVVESPDKKRRFVALEALEQIGPGEKEVIVALRSILNTDDSSQEFRSAVRETMKKIER